MAISIKINQATPEDAGIVMPLLTQFFYSEGFDTVVERLPIALIAMLNDPGSAIFFALSGSEAVGVATVTTTSQGLEFDRYAELEDLYVIPKARHQGLGGMLIDSVKQWCVHNSCSVLSVVVTLEDQADRNLIGYYQKHGFKKSERSTLFYHFVTHAA